MTRRTTRTLGALLGGAVFGGIVVFVFLAGLGEEHAEEATSTPSISPASPEVTPTPSEALLPSPTPSADTARVYNADLGVSFVLPAGYRIASTLNAFEQTRQRASPKVTITKATEAQEKEYVRLLGNLQQTQAATEAPEFLPGQTVGLALVRGMSDETFSRQLAKETTSIVSDAGLTGTRYRRVEGLSAYDVAFFPLRRDSVLSVSMSYAAQDPGFDEEAYTALVASLQSLDEK